MRNINFRLFNWIELPFALFSLFILIASIYLTFNSFLLGLFVPPIIALLVAGKIIKWINPHYEGFMFIYHTFALAGVFLLIFAFFMYKLFAPLFELVTPNKSNLRQLDNLQGIVDESTEIRKITYVDNQSNTQIVAFIPCKNVTTYYTEVYLYENGKEIGRGHLNYSVQVIIDNYNIRLMNNLSIPITIKGNYTLTSKWFGYNTPRDFVLTAESKSTSDYTDPSAENCRLGSCAFSEFLYSFENKDRITEEIRQIPLTETICQ